MNLCDKETKQDIEMYLSMTKGELKALVAKEELKLAEAQNTFNRKVEELQVRYGELETERDDTIAEVMNGGLGLMKSVSVEQGNMENKSGDTKTNNEL